jgi:hypothetical protein
MTKNATFLLRSGGVGKVHEILLLLCGVADGIETIVGAAFGRALTLTP